MLRVEECLVLMALVCMCSSANVTDCTTLPAYSFGSATGQWSYNNEVDWGDVVDTCQGDSQSPVNIVPSSAERLEVAAGYIEYLKDTTVATTNKVSTLEGEGLFAAFNARDKSGIYSIYNSAQFHIHEPSEHTIDGVSYPLELHIVFKLNSTFCNDVKNVVSVIGVFFDTDADVQTVSNGLADDLVPAESSPGEDDHFNLHTTLLAKLPPQVDAYVYSGSLTTPPCAETVNWHVVTQPLKITPAKLQELKNNFMTNSLFYDNTNNRDTQPLNDRKIGLQKLVFVEVDSFTERITDYITDKGGSSYLLTLGVLVIYTIIC